MEKIHLQKVKVYWSCSVAADAGWLLCRRDDNQSSFKVLNERWNCTRDENKQEIDREKKLKVINKKFCSFMMFGEFEDFNIYIIKDLIC